MAKHLVKFVLTRYKPGTGGIFLTPKKKVKRGITANIFRAQQFTSPAMARRYCPEGWRVIPWRKA
jgi:hypothetical protein